MRHIGWRWAASRWTSRRPFIKNHTHPHTHTHTYPHTHTHTRSIVSRRESLLVTLRKISNTRFNVAAFHNMECFMFFVHDRTVFTKLYFTNWIVFISLYTLVDFHQVIIPALTRCLYTTHFVSWFWHKVDPGKMNAEVFWKNSRPANRRPQLFRQPFRWVSWGD